MFALNIDVTNGMCFCTINLEKQKDDRFYFYLLKDDKIIDRFGWSEIPTYSKKLTESGNYYVQAHLKRANTNTLKRSESIFYSTEIGLEEIAHLWKEPQLPIDKLDFYSLKKPFSDFIVHRSPTYASRLKANEIDNDLILKHTQQTSTNRTDIFSFDSSFQSENILHFSGTALCESRLVFGSEDILPNQDTTKISTSVGNFAIIYSEGKKLKISTDYFGFGKIYYYKTAEDFVASNSYHLLILALKNIGYKLEIDINSAISKLNFVGLQPFYQNFSRKMDIKGIECLPIDKLFILSETEVSIENKEISEVLQREDEPSEEEYLSLLNQAKQEILHNFACIAESERFESIVIDVSGGMDSRLVFCAATNFPQYREKITLNSQETRGAPDELNIALAINSCYGYSYNEAAETILVPPPHGLINDLTSYYLGTYYSYNFPQTKTARNNAIRLTGFGGEIAVRPYFSRLHFNTELDVDNVADFVNLYFEKYGYLSRFGKGGSFNEHTKRLFQEELQLMPGSNALEKFEWHYLFYRNGLHCSDSWRVDASGAEFAILQSKASFELKKRCFNQHKSVKLQLDLMAALNPLLARYPYESEMDNDAKKSISVTQRCPLSYIENTQLPLIIDRKNWEAANENKKSKRTLVSDNYAVHKSEYILFMENRLSQLSSALKIICENDERLISTIAAPIYYFAKANFKGQSSGTHFQNLYTKVMSLVHQINILKM